MEKMEVYLVGRPEGQGTTEYAAVEKFKGKHLE